MLTFHTEQFITSNYLEEQINACGNGFIVTGWVDNDQTQPEAYRQSTAKMIVDAIRDYGFNCLQYTYNFLTFGAAYDSVQTDFIAINPYLKLTAIPEPQVTRYKPCVYQKLAKLPLPATGTNMQDCINFNYADLWCWNFLPHGWTTTTCMNYLPEFVNTDAVYHYYRPACSMPIDDRVFYRPERDDKVTKILHPFYPRPLTSDELQECLDDTFAMFVEASLMKCEVMEQQNYFWQTATDIRRSHRPPEHNTLYTGSKYTGGQFNWIDAIRQKGGEFKSVPQDLLNIYSIPTWREGRYVDQH